MSQIQVSALALILLFLNACSTTRKPFSPTECNEQAAHDRGFTEGKDGMNPDSEYSFECREDLRDGVRKGYREGYDKGRGEYNKRMAEWREDMRRSQEHQAEMNRPAPAPQPPAVVVYPGRPYYSQPQTTYFCVIQAFGRKHSGSGTTDLEARTRASQACEATHHAGSIFCKMDSANCQRSN